MVAINPPRPPFTKGGRTALKLMPLELGLRLEPIFMVASRVLLTEKNNPKSENLLLGIRRIKNECNKDISTLCSRNDL